VEWVLRQDPSPGESLSVAARRLAERLVELRTELAELVAQGFAVRVMLWQDQGEGFVVPAALFAEVARWGGRIEIDQFVVVDCADENPPELGILLDADQVRAHVGTDLLVAGYGTAQPAADLGWVLPWRGRVVRSVDEFGLVLDDRTVVHTNGFDGPVDRLHTVSAAVARPDALTLQGDGVVVRASAPLVYGRGFRFLDGRMTCSDAPAVLEGWAERDGLTVLWCPSSQTQVLGGDVDVDVTDLVLGGPTAGAVLQSLGIEGVRGPFEFSSWSGLLDVVGAVLTPEEGGVRLTARSEVVAQVLSRLQ